MQFVYCRNFQEISVKCPLADAPRKVSRVKCVMICTRNDKGVVYTDGMCYCEDKNTCSPDNKQNGIDDGEKNSLLIHPVLSKKSFILFLSFTMTLIQEIYAS